MSQLGSRKRILYPAIALMVPFFAACDSTLAPDLDQVPGGAATTSTGVGRLVFATPEEFQAYVEPLQNASKDALVAAEQRNGFESLRAYLDPNEDTEAAALAAEGTDGGADARAAAADSVVREDFVVGDAFLSALNSKGEVEIGGRVFKVTRDNVYEVDAGYVSVLNQKVPTLSSAPPADGDPRIVVHPVETTTPRESGEPVVAAAREGGPLFHHVPGVGNHCYVYAGSDKRMHGRSYISNFWFYSEAGVTTEWERRKKILWWWTTWSNTWQSGTLSHSWESRLVFGPWFGPWFAIGPTSGFHSQTGTSIVHNTLASGAGWGVRIRGNIHARHNVSNGFVTGSCNTAASA